MIAIETRYIYLKIEKNSEQKYICASVLLGSSNIARCII